MNKARKVEDNMKNKIRTAGASLILTAAIVFAAVAISPSPARAQDGGTGAPGPCAPGMPGDSFTEDKMNMVATAPCTLGGYSRKGTTMEVHVPVDKGGGKAMMICDGSDEAMGGWVQMSSAGQCIYRVCWMEGRPPV